MKRFCIIVFCALMICSCALALADVDLSYNPVVTNQSLLDPIRQTDYINWTLYQPTSSEIVGEDMTTDSGFQYRRFFPLVAVRENRAVLILLQRTGDGWSIFGTNEAALTRPGLTLFQFTIDSNDASGQAEGSGLPIYFGFSDPQGWYYQLGLAATDLYTTRFEFINFTSVAGGMSPKIAANLFADGFMLSFNSGFNFTYFYLFPTMQLQYSMATITGESDYDNFASFDLSKVPWSIYEAMEECTARSNASINEGKILLKQFSANDSATLCEIPDGTHLLRETGPFVLENQDWLLVAYGQMMGYLPRSNIAD